MASKHQLENRSNPYSNLVHLIKCYITNRKLNVKSERTNVLFQADVSRYRKSIHLSGMGGCYAIKLYHGVVRISKLASCSLVTSLHVDKKLHAKFAEIFSSCAKFPVKLCRCF